MSVLGANTLETAEIAKSGVGDAAIAGTRRESKAGRGRISVTGMESDSGSFSKQDRYEDTPTEEELHGPNALRRVSGKIPWTAWTIAFVELCERFSYYGESVDDTLFHPSNVSQEPRSFSSTSFNGLYQRAPTPAPGSQVNPVLLERASVYPPVSLSSTNFGHT